MVASIAPPELKFTIPFVDSGPRATGVRGLPLIPDDPSDFQNPLAPSGRPEAGGVPAHLAWFPKMIEAVTKIEPGALVRIGQQAVLGADALQLILNFPERVSLILLMFVAAWLSWRFVERPFRDAQVVRGRSRTPRL